jgi:hypothetical protein
MSEGVLAGICKLILQFIRKFKEQRRAKRKKEKN